MSELLIGCGSNRLKKLYVGGASEWASLTTLDLNPDHNPDVVHDIQTQLPFDDDSFDEIHAYEVLEHTGQQGDYEFFFNQWADFWRVLKPGGYFIGTVPLPTSPWAWGDPSHTRVIPKESFVFLSQPQYEQVGRTAMSDFRWLYKADFEPVHMGENGDILEFALQAIKPSRCTSR